LESIKIYNKEVEISAKVKVHFWCTINRAVFSHTVYTAVAVYLWQHRGYTKKAQSAIFYSLSDKHKASMRFVGYVFLRWIFCCFLRV